VFAPVARTDFPGRVHSAGGFILEICEWVFQQAAKQVGSWRAALSSHMQISVNKSPLQFFNKNASPQRWVAHLRTLGLPGESIVAEITEGLLLDDFGTGYSSLSYLQRYDIAFIKTDQSFVRDLHADSKNMAWCKAIIGMAHALGMKVIAEGVETAQQRDLLKNAVCD
jgi:EAL domain-containing protein (putative c-di-GMP-specific phosphodiesterase class I)